MKNFFSFILKIILSVGLFGCERIVDESPQIISMSISDIPQNDITINQQQRLITVTLPASLPSLELTPSFQLSKQAQLPPYWLDGKRTISLTNYCAGVYGGRSSEGLTIVTRVDNQKQTSSYTIRLQSSGPLRIKTLAEPINFDSKSPDQTITVPVENYYGSSFVEYLAVTPIGSLSPNFIGPGGGPMELCAGLLNAIQLPLAGYHATLKPGLHDLDLWLADGTIVHATKAVLVK